MTGPVSDSDLRWTAALPPVQQACLSGFGSVGLQGSHSGVHHEASRPSVPTGMGARAEVALHSLGRSQVRFQSREGGM